MRKNILCSTVLALAVIVSTGCRHHPNGTVTPLPGENSPSVAAYGNPMTIPSDQQVSSQNQPIPISSNNLPLSDYDQDTTRLAGETIHFAFDSAVVRGGDQAKLQAVAQYLQSDTRASLLIAGNCDERGTEEYNRSLGDRRADAAREALAGMSIDPNRIRTISYGKDKPVDPGHSAAAWTQNRRDDFVVLHLKNGS